LTCQIGSSALVKVALPFADIIDIAGDHRWADFEVALHMAIKAFDQKGKTILTSTTITKSTDHSFSCCPYINSNSMHQHIAEKHNFQPSKSCFLGIDLG